MNVCLRRIRFLFITASVVAVLACAGAGRKWDTTHASEVQRGVHDKARIQAWFGAPYQMAPIAEHPMGCTERWTYTYAWSKWAGTQTTVDTLVVDFDANGVVCDHAYLKQ